MDELTLIGSFKKSIMKYVIGIYLLVSMQMNCSSNKKSIASETSQANPQKVAWLSHYKTLCYHESADLCHMVKYSETDNYELLYGFLSGFDFQWGNEYKLLIETIENNEEDALDEIKVVEVLDTKKVETPFQIALLGSEINKMKEDPDNFKLMGNIPVELTLDGRREIENQDFISGNPIGEFKVLEGSQKLQLLKIKNKK